MSCNGLRNLTKKKYIKQKFRHRVHKTHIYSDLVLHDYLKMIDLSMGILNHLRHFHTNPPLTSRALIISSNKSHSPFYTFLLTTDTSGLFE